MREKFINLSFLIAGILIAAHIFQFIDSGYQLEPLLRVILWAAYIPTGLIFRDKSLPYIFPLFAYAVLIFNRFQNYTSFLIILMAIKINPKWRWGYLAIYAVDVIAALLIRNLTASHAIIHFLNCALIYCFYVFLFEIQPPAKLDLKADEREILQQWSQTKNIKSITAFSHNTIYEKLRAARIRNNCKSNDELLEKYVNQYGIGTK